MPQYNYDDVLEADSPRQVTHASFWRHRASISPRIAWGLIVRRPALVADPPPVQVDGIPWEIRRHLARDRGELREVACKLSLYWRAPAAELFAGDPSDWQSASVCLLHHVPRRVLVQLARFLETPSVIHTRRGRDSRIDLLSTAPDAPDGSPPDGLELGLDRHGMIDVHEMFETYLRDLLDLPDAAELACYLAAPPGSFSNACLNYEHSCRQMHERLRDRASAGE